jgi:hypothetical protein
MPRKWHVRFCRRVHGVTHGLSQLADAVSWNLPAFSTCGDRFPRRSPGLAGTGADHLWRPGR